MKTWRRAARIGVVIHGPEVVDSGQATKIIEYLKKFGSVTAVLGGTMGRVAVLDAGLQSVIAISPHRRPSRSIRDLQPACDVVLLLCQSKSRESGLAFSMAVARAAAASKPLIQIDCGGKFVAQLAGKKEELGLTAAGDLGLDILKPTYSNGILRQGNDVKRTLAGVLPGELISVNGTVIARATDRSVEIQARDGIIVGMKGADPKQHGLEKLPIIDLEKAVIRSGSIRRTKALPKLQERRINGGAAFIDHCAEDAFQAAKGAAVAVTVGDDTTAIAGDILSRLGTIVIGIVDGDLDRLAAGMQMLKGSRIITVQPGYDDVVGRKVKEDVFHGESRVELGPDDLLVRVTKIASDFMVKMEKI